MGKAAHKDHLTTEQAAAHLGLSPRTLERYRVRGGGPPFVSYCNRVHYLRGDLDTWVDERRRLSTSDTGAFAGKRDRGPVRRKKSPAGRLSVIELAALLGVCRRTLDRYRAKGTGPAFEKVDGRVLYFRSGLEAWIARNRPAPHSEAAAKSDRDSGKGGGQGDRSGREGEA